MSEQAREGSRTPAFTSLRTWGCISRKKKSASRKAAPGESRVRSEGGAICLQSDLATVLPSHPAFPQGDRLPLSGIHGRVLRQANLSRSHSPRDLGMS